MGIVDAEALIAWGYDISNRTDVVGRRFKFSPVGLFPFLWTETGGVIDIGTEEGAANAVNLLGHVAGQSGGAFFWTPEEGLIDLPAGASGYATDVNDLDIVVGTSYASGFSRPFRWTAQEGLTHLGTLQGRATAINNRGQVVGDFGLRAFRWDATVGVTELSMLPGDLSSSATDITDAGHVVGWTSGASGQRAALWTADGQVFDLGTYPGDYRSQAHGINRRGIVVGESWEPIGVGTYRPRAVLWTLD